MDKKKLSIKSINEILAQLQGDDKLLYDKDLIERLYQQYQDVECDDTEDVERLANEFAGKKILLLAPGNNICAQKPLVDSYIKEQRPLVIGVGFVPRGYDVDYVFLSNSKRYVQLSGLLCAPGRKMKTIATSNVAIAAGCFDYLLRYSSLLDEAALIVDNPLIMLLKLLAGLGISEVALAGFDGYTTRTVSDYVNPNMEHAFSKEKALEINADVIASLERLSLEYPLTYVTDSLYA
jgi:4-hydroxy 2-oxovalerate aldolase